MARQTLDCRNFPSEKNCTVAISADTHEELLDAAVAHAVASHGHENTPELRAQISGGIQAGVPA